MFRGLGDAFFSESWWKTVRDEHSLMVLRHEGFCFEAIDKFRKRQFYVLRVFTLGAIGVYPHEVGVLKCFNVHRMYANCYGVTI